MYMDLMDVLREPGRLIERRIDISPTIIDDVEIVNPVRGTVRATNARQSLVISGRASTAVQMRCGRCLRAYVQPLELELEAVAPLGFFRERLTGEPDDENEPDDEIVALFDAHTLDVLELVRQAIVLQWPIQPLCAPDCPGLPLATQYTEAQDERWNALRNWKELNDGSA